MAGFADGLKSLFLIGFPVATAIFAGNTDIMCETARILGDGEAEEKREGLLERLMKRIEENHGCMDTSFMSVPYILVSENGKRNNPAG